VNTEAAVAVQGSDFRAGMCRKRSTVIFYPDLDIGYPAVAASRGEITMPDAIFCKDLSGATGL
jgi:hypothetical protein